MAGEKIKEIGGTVLGPLVAAVIMLCPIPGLEQQGKICLALSMMTVCWWALKVMHPGFVSLALLTGFSIFLDAKVVPGTVIFSSWTSPIMYLVIGGFLIAEAVRVSGLGERFAYLYIHKFINSYRGIIVSCYLLGAALSFLIPHPWPRSFLILSVMECVIQASAMEEKYADNICLAVFAGSVSTSMILLTGDSTLNPIVAGFAGETMSWGRWLLYMAVPAILEMILMILVQLKLFGSPASFHLDKGMIHSRLKERAGMSRNEWICLIVLAIAVICWMSDSVIGIHPAWVAIGAVIIFALPGIGILNGNSLSTVNIGTLLFLAAALSIGNVGRLTGMNAWIAQVVLPASCPPNPYIFALVTCLICMAIHMVLGSTLAVLGIAVPAIVTFAENAGFPALNAALIAYIAVASHWLLPFHHMNILVGRCTDGGSLKEKQVLKMGLAGTGVTLIICMAAVTWWLAVGLI